MVKITFGKYLWLLCQAAVEPILLTSALAILFVRFQAISTEVYLSTGSQNIWAILVAINDNMESDSIIYYIVFGVFVAWILYRTWKLRRQLLQDKYSEKMLEIHSAQTKTLNKLANDMAEVKESLKDIEKGSNGD